MNDYEKTKVQLIEELVELRQEVERLREIEMVQAETREALQESELRYKVLFDSTPAALYTKDLEGRYTGVNTNTLTYWSSSPLGFTDAELLPEEIATKLREADLRVIKAQKEIVLEEEIEAPTGLRTVLTHKVPLRDVNGNVNGILGASVDISDRKQAEERLTKLVTELETVAQVSVATSTILNTNELLQEVSDLTKERFDLYHVHVYLYNSVYNNLELVAGAGDVGQRLVEEGWHIPFAQEKSLVARAARTRRGVIVNDVSQDTDFLPNKLLPETRSEMAVPMIAGGTLLGVLDVQSDQENYFTEEDIQVQTTLASLVAVALHNVQQYETTQSTLQEMRLLYDTSVKLNLSDNLEDTLLALIQPAIDTGAITAGMLTFDLDATGQPEWGQVAAVWEREGQPVFPIGTRFKLADFATTHLWLDDPSTPLFFENVARDERVDAATQAIFEQLEIQAAVWLPLSIREQWVGIVYIYWSEPYVFSNSEQRLFSLLTNQAVVLINNYLLLEQTRRQARREQIVNAITQKIQGTVTIETALQTAIQELGQALQARYTQVKLTTGEDENKSELPVDKMRNGN